MPSTCTFVNEAMVIIIYFGGIALQLPHIEYLVEGKDVIYNFLLKIEKAVK